MAYRHRHKHKCRPSNRHVFYMGVKTNLVLSDWLLYICSLVEFAPAKNRIQHFSYILVEFFRFLAVSASYLIMNKKRIKLTLS
jgi:hypothetical protein